VLKVGGSLLDWPDLPRALARLLDTMRSQLGTPVVLVGGGRVVDEIRRLDRIHQLAASPVHELAIRALDLTAHLLPTLVPSQRWLVVQTEDDFARALVQEKVPILAPWHWLARDDSSGGRTGLPHGWEATSDSIAAHLAAMLGIPHVILAKSASPPPPGDLPTAVASGLVDSLVATQCDRLSALGVCNLRRDLTEIQWLFGRPQELLPRVTGPESSPDEPRLRPARASSLSESAASRESR
jgi:aspartokinase-like uncharacterized kinase